MKDRAGEACERLNAARTAITPTGLQGRGLRHTQQKIERIQTNRKSQRAHHCEALPPAVETRLGAASKMLGARASRRRLVAGSGTLQEQSRPSLRRSILDPRRRLTGWRSTRERTRTLTVTAQLKPARSGSLACRVGRPTPAWTSSWAWLLALVADQRSASMGRGSRESSRACGRLALLRRRRTWHAPSLGRRRDRALECTTPRSRPSSPRQLDPGSASQCEPAARQRPGCLSVAGRPGRARGQEVEVAAVQTSRSPSSPTGPG